MNIGDFKAYLENGRVGANTPLPEGLPSTIRPVVQMGEESEIETNVEAPSRLEDDGTVAETEEGEAVAVIDADSCSPISKYLKLASFVKG